MRIEVQIEDEESFFFQINKDKLLIGAGEAADLILPAKPGVSRKHLELTCVGKKYFVTDLGSTNGTFINKKRLASNTRTEFPPLSPIRLSDDVYLTLVNDDESGPTDNPVKEAEDITSTRKISMADLNAKDKTKAIIAKKEENKSKAVVKKDSSFSPKKKAIIGVIGLLALAAAYYFIAPF